MRLAVLDVGSNSVHLLIVDARTGGLPLPVHSTKTRSRLAERVEPDGRLGPQALAGLLTAVEKATAAARRLGVDALFAYATAVIRDAPNRVEVLDAVEDATGIRLGLLSGVEEAQLTFLAARRWLGWRAGQILLLDIGGGSLELACGRDRLPDVAVSLPLGAGRLTREFLRADPPKARAVAALRQHVRAELREMSERTRWEGPCTTVATSKTFQQLARLTGAPPQRLGPFVTRTLSRRALRPWVDRLAGLPADRRAALPGISPHRARQVLAGAVVAYTAMKRLHIEELRICPWALREGILLRQLEAQQPPLESAAWVPWASETERGLFAGEPALVAA